MNRKIKLKTKSYNYDILIGKGQTEKFLSSLNKSNNKKYLLIDKKIYNNYKNLFNKLSKKNFFIITITGNEKLKSFSYYIRISSILLSKKIDRSSWIVAIGGGTIGDISGFIASTIMRGVKLVFIPTTLLSQVDSSIGGKNGINTAYGKNLIGTFYQPQFVIVDTNFLETLPKKQIKSGYAEIIKYALINDKKFFEWLEVNFKRIFKLENKYIFLAIIKSINIKKRFVLNDEKEILINSNSRAMLNLGHTFGHALESMNNYKSSLTHGEAISIGMSFAAKISHKIGKISRNSHNRIISHLVKCGLPINSTLVNNKFYALLKNDKKNRNNQINLILLDKIGSAYYAKNFNLIKLKQILSS